MNPHYVLYSASNNAIIIYSCNRNGEGILIGYIGNQLKKLKEEETQKENVVLSIN